MPQIEKPADIAVKLFDGFCIGILKAFMKL
jgi:hypothetical protein